MQCVLYMQNYLLFSLAVYAYISIFCKSGSYFILLKQKDLSQLFSSFILFIKVGEALLLCLFSVPHLLVVGHLNVFLLFALPDWMTPSLQINFKIGS